MEEEVGVKGEAGVKEKDVGRGIGGGDGSGNWVVVFGLFDDEEDNEEYKDDCNEDDEGYDDVYGKSNCTISR